MDRVELTAIAQVELTSRCDRACRACPRGTATITPNEQEMPREVFERAVDATIRPGQRYHLQGRGEPLLRPDFVELAWSIAARRRRLLGH